MYGVFTAKNISTAVRTNVPDVPERQIPRVFDTRLKHSFIIRAINVKKTLKPSEFFGDKNSHAIFRYGDRERW